jgi:phosphatidylinositol-3-phosphatase
LALMLGHDRSTGAGRTRSRPLGALAAPAGAVLLLAAVTLVAPGAAERSDAAAAPGAQHVFVVMMENTDWASVKGSSSFPYVNGTLLPGFASADDYNSGLHPSLPNYVELEAGSTLGLTDGSYLPTDHSVSTTAHLTTQLRNAGLGWKYYAENLPGAGSICNLGDPGTPYSEDHNPFVYFQDVQSDPAYCIQHERPFSELATDLGANTVPDYSFIVPNDWDQGEKLAPGSSCAACQADGFLKGEIPAIQASAAYRAGGVILVLWDESGNRSANTSGLIVVSDLAKKGYAGKTAYDHGSTLRTVQELLGVGPLLGDAATSADLSDLFATWPIGSPASPTSPTAAFADTPTSGAAPLTVGFTDGSTGAPTSWSWDFGDGTVATTENPSHSYASPGVYTVTLTASNATGSSTVSKTAEITVTAAPPPTAAFSTAPGPAPLSVAFTDTSSGAPSAWSWDFGEPGSSTDTSTSRSPSHVYAAPGSYTVGLTVSNASGSNAVTHTVVVSPAAVAVTAGASTSATASSASTSVVLRRPAGTLDGDVLIANIDADANPTMSSAPAGWSAVTVALTDTTYARVFSYFHVVASAAAEPSTYGFRLSAAKRWNGGVTVFHGVNRATPFDTAAATKVVTSSATAITVPGVTTVTPGAMLVGGAGLNSLTTTLTAPKGWTEAWEADGGQDADLAYRSVPAAGATGTATWVPSVGNSGAAWVRALRPAGR